MINMKLESNGVKVLQALQVPEPLPLPAIQGWGDSYSRMPEKIFFLDPQWLMDRCNYLQMSQEDKKDIAECSAIIRQNPILTAYLWHTYNRLVSDYHDGAPPADFYTYPMPSHDLGKRAQVFLVIALLGATENMLIKYRQNHIPEEVIEATLQTVGGGIKSYRQNHGVCGVSVAGFAWTRLNLAGRLLQLGRFNFKLKETNDFGVLAKNRKSGKKVLLCQAGFKINAKGICVIKEDVNGEKIRDPRLSQCHFTTTLERTAKGWKGYISHPAGYVIPGIRELNEEEWEFLIEPGDIMMDLHIPSGGNMTPDRCRDSLSYAFEFFSKHFPGRFKPAFISHSWIFNPQLEEILPNSNPAKFMQELYLYPAPSIGQDGFFFIFGRYFKKEELADAPRDNTLRRALLDLYRKTPLRTGGMIYLAEDLPNFGQKIYRTQFPF